MNTQLNPSSDQLISMLKFCVTMFCGYAVNRGYMSGDLTELVSGFVVATAMLGVGIYTHTVSARLKSAAAVNPGIIITVPKDVAANNPAIAAVVNNTNIPQVQAAAA